MELQGRYLFSWRRNNSEKSLLRKDIPCKYIIFYWYICTYETINQQTINPF